MLALANDTACRPVKCTNLCTSWMNPRPNKREPIRSIRKNTPPKEPKLGSADMCLYEPPQLGPLLRNRVSTCHIFTFTLRGCPNCYGSIQNNPKEGKVNMNIQKGGIAFEGVPSVRTVMTTFWHNCHPWKGWISACFKSCYIWIYLSGTSSPFLYVIPVFCSRKSVSGQEISGKWKDTNTNICV